MSEPCCRFCTAPLTESFADLGMSPLSNAFVPAAARDGAETFYPLHARVCGRCFLVQLEAFETPQAIFGDYAYFSSYADSWLRHCEVYARTMTGAHALATAGRRVIEIASNDGYLLQYFARAGVEVLGIEPAANVAAVARERGIPTRVAFFGSALARELREAGQGADLLIGNNVLAHVPDLNDFVAGLALVLRPQGLITMEFPHLLRLIAECQFDTIYHEHFSYFSLGVVERVFAAHGLVIVDVEELPTHGGSLRIHARHRAAAPGAPGPRVEALRAREHAAGLECIETYRGFAARVRELKRGLLRFLIDAADAGCRVVGYGAPAKGVTLLNYCGVREDLLPYTVDRSPHKQGHLLPGVRIPVHAPERIFSDRPDYVLILPWNLSEEIVAQMAGIGAWGGRFVVPVPQVREIIPR
ncbi:MAG: hypothetical protein CALGDGBN_02680 [Pseudomonadales bacterium]|nr:hypothetical protein [Pseudomonadales bacterium]